MPFFLAVFALPLASGLLGVNLRAALGILNVLTCCVGGCAALRDGRAASERSEGRERDGRAAVVRERQMQAGAVGVRRRAEKARSSDMFVMSSGAQEMKQGARLRLLLRPFAAARPRLASDASEELSIDTMTTEK